jgi:hypothetical protein
VGVEWPGSDKEFLKDKGEGIKDKMGRTVFVARDRVSLEQLPRFENSQNVNDSYLSFAETFPRCHFHVSRIPETSK